MIDGRTFKVGFGSAPELHETHHCDDDTIGWGDIAGIRKIKGKTVEEEIAELTKK